MKVARVVNDIQINEEVVVFSDRAATLNKVIMGLKNPANTTERTLNK